MNKYQEGKIYKITTIHHDLPYYGSTVMSLSKRLYNHRITLKCGKNHASGILLKLGDCKIELVERYPCSSRKELSERENYYIENNECVNFRIAYVKDMRERRKVHDKKHYEKNRDKYLKIMSNYRKENKEKLYKRAGEKIECECGSKVRRSDIARHKKSKTHQNYLNTC